MAKAKSPETLSYEKAFEELEALVERLESGDLALEEALALFQRGQALVERCNTLLEEAELKLRKLTPDDAGGYVETDMEEEPS